jgi:hypothetical protein
MGYTTDFSGEFEIGPEPLAPEHLAYLKAFNGTRRMKRNAEITKTLPDPIREAVGLPVGPEGAYYVGSTSDFGQDHTPDIVDYNTAPGAPNSDDFYEGFPPDAWEKYSAAKDMAVAEGAQPGLWCQWRPDEGGTAIVWDEGEKFYDYVEWLRYLVEHFLRPWGYVLNGEVTWQGEESDDIGKIVVADNKIEVKHGRVIYQ